MPLGPFVGGRFQEVGGGHIQLRGCHLEAPSDVRIYGRQELPFLAFSSWTFFSPSLLGDGFSSAITLPVRRALPRTVPWVAGRGKRLGRHSTIFPPSNWRFFFSFKSNHSLKSRQFRHRLKLKSSIGLAAEAPLRAGLLCLPPGAERTRRRGPLRSLWPVNRLVPKPHDHRDNDDCGQNSHPPSSIEIEAGTFEPQLVIGHDRALHLETESPWGTIHLPTKFAPRQIAG